MCSRSAVLLALALVLTACQDMVVYRAGQDYVPLDTGSSWKYLVDGDTTYREVLGDSSIGGRLSTIVAEDFLPGFWVAEPTRVSRYYDRTCNLGGQDYTLEARYGLVYLFPFVAGNGWSEEFRATVVVLGNDTIPVFHRLEAHVAGVESVATPAGTFYDCYRLEMHEEVYDTDTSVTTWTEWLAPGVGLVRRLSGAGDMLLAEYRIGPASE